MFFSVLLCFLVTALIPLCSTHFSQEARYECGPHGKFEYCIDGIPGCVIGCHCHPGYYFDTDSKICEPNIQLSQGFRRHYLAEPTHPHAPEYFPTVTDAIPTPTAKDNFDKKVNEVDKEANELGDWLYNQFFKTIENQVINHSNNTNTNNKEKRPTRRSGDSIDTVINKSKRKTRKSNGHSKKKKRTKAHGLRRKLLRITEDDSLFEESESTSSDTDSDSDSESSEDGSCDSRESKKSHEDKEHGHRKVIIFNKRPKPPLPSFIFLPSMDTPFYPPIGLPLPPPMPMYPMVPVPPMAPPGMFPFPVPPVPVEPDKNADSTTPVVTTTTTTSTTTTTTAVETTTPAETTTETEVITEPSSLLLRLGDKRNKLDRHQSRRLPEEFMTHSREPGRIPTSKHGSRNRLMHKLREKMMENRKNIMPPMDTQPLEEFLDGKSQIIDEAPCSSEACMPPNRLPERTSGDQMPKLEDVDFKYLSELIHRVNQSDANNRRPPLPFDLNEDLKALQNLKSQYTRRNFSPYYVEPEYSQHETNPHRHLRGSDDVYYTNLGRQIASMIRSADSKVDHQINKKIAQAKRQVPFHSVLNENNYAPRSFFERSVRSPLKQTGVFTNYLDESRTLKHSYINKLFNLEDEVESVANTPAPLSLQDLENILNTMQRVNDHINYRGPVKSMSNISLNVNLLPKYVKYVRTGNTNRKLFIPPDTVDYITEHYQRPPPPKIYVEMQAVNATNKTVLHDPDRSEDSSYWMFNNNQHPRPILAPQINQSLVHDHQKYNTNLTRHHYVAAVHATTTVAKKPSEYLQFLRSMPVIKHTTAKRPDPKFQHNSPVVNFKSMNYFSGNKHRYMFEKSTYPIHIKPFKRRARKPFRTMNRFYFHDYFD